MCLCTVVHTCVSHLTSIWDWIVYCTLLYVCGVRRFMYTYKHSYVSTFPHVYLSLSHSQTLLLNMSECIICYPLIDVTVCKNKKQKQKKKIHKMKEQRQHNSIALKLRARNKWNIIYDFYYYFDFAIHSVRNLIRDLCRGVVSM